MLFNALQNQVTTRSSQTVSGGGLFGVFGSGKSKSGALVNNDSAFTLSAFYNGIEILCNDFAKLPKSVYKKESGDRKKIEGHELSYLVSKRPNSLMTAFSFDKIMLQYAIVKGNAYAIIERNDLTQKVKALHVVDQNKTPVVVKLSNGRLWYHIGTTVYSDFEMLHIPGFSFNGITGVGVVTVAANSLGVALASQDFASEYYDSKGEGIAVITSAKPIDTDAKVRLSNAVSKRLSQKGMVKTTVLDEVGSFQHIKLTPQESQFLQTNENGVIEVARWINLPPHKLKSLGNATFSNIEHQEIQHVSDSILPWALKFQNEYDVKLFTEKEIRENYYFKFNTKSLLQADIQSQADYLTKLVFAGVYSRADARMYLEENKVEGLDDYLVPVNTKTLEEIDLKLAELKKGLKDV